MPFTYQILLDPAQIGIDVTPPVVVREVFFAGSGVATAETPILRITLGRHDYDLRLRFHCWITVRVAPGDKLELGALLASGVAEGEHLPDNYRYCHALLVNPSDGDSTS
jgi:hypothetical protein